MSVVSSCAFLVDGRTVVVELTDCALVAELDGVRRDLSPAAAALYVAGVEDLVGRGGVAPVDAVEVGTVRLVAAGAEARCAVWVVDVEAGAVGHVTAEAFTATAAVGVAGWIAAGAVEQSAVEQGDVEQGGGRDTAG